MNEEKTEKVEKRSEEEKKEFSIHNVEILFSRSLSGDYKKKDLKNLNGFTLHNYTKISINPTKNLYSAFEDFLNKEDIKKEILGSYLLEEEIKNIIIQPASLQIGKLGYLGSTEGVKKYTQEDLKKMTADGVSNDLSKSSYNYISIALFKKGKDN